jgi:hypothetical protein
MGVEFLWAALVLLLLWLAWRPHLLLNSEAKISEGFSQCSCSSFRFGPCTSEPQKHFSHLIPPFSHGHHHLCLLFPSWRGGSGALSFLTLLLLSGAFLGTLPSSRWCQTLLMACLVQDSFLFLLQHLGTVVAGFPGVAYFCCKGGILFLLFSFSTYSGVHWSLGCVMTPPPPCLSLVLWGGGRGRAFLFLQNILPEFLPTRRPQTSRPPPPPGWPLRRGPSFLGFSPLG